MSVLVASGSSYAFLAKFRLHLVTQWPFIAVIVLCKPLEQNSTSSFQGLIPSSIFTWCVVPCVVMGFGILLTLAVHKSQLSGHNTEIYCLHCRNKHFMVVMKLNFKIIFRMIFIAAYKLRKVRLSCMSQVWCSSFGTLTEVEPQKVGIGRWTQMTHLYKQFSQHHR